LDVPRTSLLDSSAMRREHNRRKLLGLHHAAYCTSASNSPFSGHAHCMAHKRMLMFSHTASCRDPKCAIPGCAKARLIWTHFSTCTNTACAICSVVPEQDRLMSAKVSCPRSPKLTNYSGKSFKRSTMGRPPLSPKARDPYFEESRSRSPP
jgi:E1A/CREB-binding protein